MSSPSVSPLHYTLRSIPPVYEIIFDNLSPLNIIRVSLTCKDGFKATCDYKTRTFSINRLLARFFKDPLEFRSLQARTGTIISGSQALQFFRRSYWPGSDLDLYTKTEEAVEVGSWLIKEGYRFRPNTLQPLDFLDIKDYIPTEEQVLSWREHTPTTNIDDQHRGLYKLPGISIVLSFEKQTSSGDTLTVQVVGARKTPIGVIARFHSTAVMNFISWNKAYSLYPYATLEKSRSLIKYVPLHPSSQYDEALIKYSTRGFTMVAAMYPHEDKRCVFNEGYRFVCDRHTWALPLDTQGVEPPDSHPFTSFHVDQYLANGWELIKTLQPLDTDLSSDRHILELEVEHSLVYSSILKYFYIAPMPFIDYCTAFFVAQGRLEYKKVFRMEPSALHAESRPTEWPPRFWHFYDEEYIEILRQWMRELPPWNQDKIVQVG